MEPSDGLTLWLGPLAPPPRLEAGIGWEPPAERMLLLGAGFIKATNRSAPFFNDYRPGLQRVLENDPVLPHR